MIPRNSNGRRRVLVTGGSGFVGQHVIRALHEHGNDVVALQHRSDLPRPIGSHCCDVLWGNICDRDVQSKVVHDVDAICHLAAYIPKSMTDSDEAKQCYRVNALATLGLAKAAVEQGVKRFVYLSTGNFYSASDRQATEDDRVFPSEVATYYFVSKLAGEIYLAHVCQHSDTGTVTLRIGTPYGPGEPEEKVVATFMRRAARGETLRVFHGGEATYNFVYVEDVARGVAEAVQAGLLGTYNFASGEHTPLRTLAEAVAGVHAEHEISIVIEPATDGSPLGFAPISVEKSHKAWGFAPRGLLEGLRRYRSLTESGNHQ